MNNLIILNEVSKTQMKKSTKTFKCPYCDKRLDRVKLVSHIEKEHAVLIPTEYSAARLVFNIVNKKDHGTCTVCGKESPWNETTWRYERYCCEPCRTKAGDQARANIKKIHGVENLLHLPDHQVKMLGGRSISGVYVFSTGGSLPYVGTYELKFLEFCDIVMGFKVSDFDTPPVIKYEYEGSHFWIPDYYLVPFNLVFDIKDGGDNPNNREMTVYRGKQDAKELAIKDLDLYNYIRLTNNNFAQLLLVLAELKEQFMNRSDNNHIIKINEAASYDSYLEPSYSSVSEACDAVLGCMQGTGTAFIVPYMQKNSFSLDYGITSDQNLSSVLTINGETSEFEVKDFKFFDEGCDYYSQFKYNQTPFVNNTEDPSNVYELLTGSRMLAPDQVFYDSRFESIVTPSDRNRIEADCLEATLIGCAYSVPMIYESYIMEDRVMFFEDNKGSFVSNISSGVRSKSYPSVDDIPKDVIDIVIKS